MVVAPGDCVEDAVAVAPVVEIAVALLVAVGRIGVAVLVAVGRMGVAVDVWVAVAIAAVAVVVAVTPGVGPLRVTPQKPPYRV